MSAYASFFASMTVCSASAELWPNRPCRSARACPASSAPRCPVHWAAVRRPSSRDTSPRAGQPIRARNSARSPAVSTPPSAGRAGQHVACDLALVVRRAAAGRDLLVAPREIRVAEHLADVRRPPVRQERAGRVRMRAEGALGCPATRPPSAPRPGHPSRASPMAGASTRRAAGVRNVRASPPTRPRPQARSRHGCPPAACLCTRPGSAVPATVPAGAHPLALRPTGRSWRLSWTMANRSPPIPFIRRHDAHHGIGGHRCVDGVAARGQDRRTGLRRERVFAGDNAGGRDDHRSRVRSVDHHPGIVGGSLGRTGWLSVRHGMHDSKHHSASVSPDAPTNRRAPSAALADVLRKNRKAR